MDFDLTEEQRLLKDSVDRMTADLYAFDARQGHRGHQDGWNCAMWQQFADQGLLGLPFAEEHGGFGGGPVESEHRHGGLWPRPGRRALPRHRRHVRRPVAPRRQPKQLAELVPGIAAGERVLAYAQAERQARWSLNDINTRAVQAQAGDVQAGDGGPAWRLTGEKTLRPARR